MLMAATVICSATMSQTIGTKVKRVNLIDGKTYTGTITDIKDGKYHIKYDDVNFDAWLTSNQFTVTDNTAANNQTPALPQVNNQPAANDQQKPDIQTEQKNTNNNELPNQNK